MNYLYNCDLNIWQQFCFQTGLFPYALANVRIDTKNRLINWSLLESYTQLDYEKIPFRSLWVQPKFSQKTLQRGKLISIKLHQSFDENIKQSENEPKC